MRTLSAVDLFCGAGGFTEGFKQAGVDVRACLDLWQPAVETHRKNHPDTEVFRADILDFEPSELPEADVLIGSPPCTEFSYANRGGHGDLGLGMRFVLRYLRFVHDLRPKYWIMENVPRLFQTLPDRVHLKRLGLPGDGFLEIPVRRILNSADYGVPQKRLRLISGRIPLPEQTHSWADGLGSFANLEPWVPVKHVLGLLPDPLGQPNPKSRVHDPCFDLALSEQLLTDHFMDTRLSTEEVEVNRKSKTDHSWYGRMAFPDPLDRPARTVMATQTGVSRETLIIEEKKESRDYYRRPTIRECASFQSFPITYQFWGTTAQTRYKLVGNAVPPLLAQALARALLRKEDLTIPGTPILTRTVSDAPPPVTLVPTSARAREFRYPPTRKFRDHLPGSKSHGVRVDFANVITFGESESEEDSEVVWEARLVAGSGKTVFVASPGLASTLTLLIRWGQLHDEAARVEGFARAVEAKCRTVTVDGEGLQDVWTGRSPKADQSPPKLLRGLATVVETFFPAASFEDVVVEIPRSFPSLGRSLAPLRSAAQFYAARRLADAVNAPATTRTADELLREATLEIPETRSKRRSTLVELAN